MANPSADIEIPYKEDRGFKYRFFEILPGALSWFMLSLPLILSFINVTFASIFILFYLLIFFARSIGVNIRSFQGYGMMETHKRLPWRKMLRELETGKVDTAAAGDDKRPEWHEHNVKRFLERRAAMAVGANVSGGYELPAVSGTAEAGQADWPGAEGEVIGVEGAAGEDGEEVSDSEPEIATLPSELTHVIMIATYNETREVIEPTIQQVLASDYDMNQVVLVIAYEERGGPEVGRQSRELVKIYKEKFKHAMAIEHPSDIGREVTGKGGNITYAARQVTEWLDKQKIDPMKTVVTTLDADNRPHPKYLAALSYVYCVYPDPERVSIQPISVYNNNIWDAPAPMRVIATGNTFFNIVLSLRPHMLRNFSAHAQSWAGIVKTDYWSVRTVVEDGHQFWRSYFAFDGNYRVLPLYVPIYQDAVLADGYIKTLKAQFGQLKRWTYGASDIAYVVMQTRRKWRRLPKFDALTKIWRLIEGHVTWAVGPLISLTAGFIPALVIGFMPEIAEQQEIAALNLPEIVSRIQTIALIGLSASLFICIKTLPPRPARYKRTRSIFVVLQWLYLPLTTIAYNSFAALYSQTRLMFGKYLDKFNVTEKAVKTTEGKTISRDTRE
jgi:hypothetical protein